MQTKNYEIVVFTLAAAWLAVAAAPAPAALVVQIGRNFTGSTYQIDSFAQPPDSNGAVGPNHFVELINGRYSVYSKSSGARVRTLTDVQFWKNSGIDLGANLDVTDPRVVFDTYSQRWFASAVDVDFNSTITNRFLIAVSAASDPTGAWHGFAFPSDPVDGNFADFPTLGVDAGGVYLSGDLFDDLGNNVGTALVSIPKSGLLADPPDISGRTSFGILSYDERGDVLQPAMTTGAASTGASVLAVGDLGYDFASHSNLVFSTIDNATNSAGATLSDATVLVGPLYTVPINPPQPDGTSNLDDGDARIGSCVRRVDDILYAAHAVEVNDRAAVRWYKIDVVNRTLMQSGTISDDKLDLFYPSIAANAAGTVVIGCNGSSSNVFVSSYAVVGETTDGVVRFGKLMLLKAGKASYQNPDSDTQTSRWGDYSATSCDPTDPNRFWTIQMIPTARTTWVTQITELITSPLRLDVTFASTNLLVLWPATASGFQLEHAADLPPTGVWAPVTQTPTVVNGQFTVSLPATNVTGFFRLTGQ